jgi:hypothetical protein
MSLLPTFHLGLAQRELRDYGVLRGTSSQHGDTVVAYVMTTDSQSGELESKLMWGNVTV